MALSAIRENLSPSPLPAAGLSRVSIALNQEETDLVESSTSHGVRECKDYPIGKLIGAYCYAKIQALQSSTTEADEFQDRPDQQKFYKAIKIGLENKNIVLAEGGTGLGKSRVLGMLARDMIANGEGPVCITAPTISILRHIYKEIEKAPYTEHLDIAIVLGKSQFIDPQKLSLALDDPEIGKSIPNKTEISAWLNNNCPPLHETDTIMLEDVCPGISYLKSDMLHICPELSAVSGLALQNNNEEEDEAINPALQVYKDLFENAQSADVIICSHAMLAFDIYMHVLRGEEAGSAGFLPRCSCLLVDEAHMLETAVSSISSTDISIITLLSNLRKSTLGAKKWRTEAEKICNEILQVSKTKKAIDNVCVHPNDWHEKAIDPDTYNVMRKVESLNETLRKLFPKKGFYNFAGSGVDQQIHDAAKTLAQISFHKQAVMINVSPIRRFPSFAVGPVTVKHYFENLWNRTKRAALVSATLTLPDVMNLPNPSHIQRVLNIPGPRMLVTEPVHPKWLYKPIHLQVPKKQDLPIFLPPKITAEELASQELDEENVTEYTHWLNALSGKFENDIFTNAIGGTLVLLTSYALLNKMGERFTGDRFIFQDKSIPFSVQLNKFLEMAKDGERPIWFALGNAWTGTDITGQHFGILAEQDNILSDLVIPRIPFGMNSTMTALTRNRRMKTENGYTPLPLSGRNDAAFLFKQGVGRLVRREGVPNKNLWILDSRIWLGNKKFYGVFQRILKIYE